MFHKASVPRPPGSALCKQEHQHQDNYRNQRQQDVEQNLSRPGRSAFSPVTQLRPFGDAYFFGMLEIQDHLVSVGIAILRVAFQRAVNDFLQLRRN